MESGKLQAGRGIRVGWRGRLGTAALTVACHAQVPAAKSAAPLDAAIVSSRQFDIHYKAGTTSAPLTEAELWYTIDDGKTWHRHGRDMDRTSPIPFLAPAEGLFGFHVILRNRHGASSPPPVSGTAPQRWVLVDFTSPVVQFRHARLEAEREDGPHVQLRWSAYDAHLPPRPVRIEYRTDVDANWTVIVTHLTNRGRFDWAIPDGVHGDVWFRLTVRDRAGHVVEQTFGPVRIEAAAVRAAAAPGILIPKPDEDPRDAQPVATTQAARSMVSPAAAEEAISRFELGTFHRLRGELGVAAERFREALRLDPTHLAAANDLAGVLYLSGAYDQATAAYEDVLRQAPAHRSALKGLALAYMARRDYRNAHTRFAELLKLEPDKGENWLHLGDVAMLSGNTLDAHGYWSKALTVEPKARAIIDKASNRLAALRSVNEGFASSKSYAASSPPAVRAARD